MKKTMFFINAAFVMILFTACLRLNTETNLTPSSTSNANPQRSTSLTPEEENPLLNEEYKKYAEPFRYQLGRNAWKNAEEIAPDALVTYYFYLGLTDELTISPDYPMDDNYGNPLIPAEDLEKCVQRHFDVTSEHIRQSQYYDNKEKAYWTGGIGTTVDINVVNVEQNDNLLTMDYFAWINSSDYNSNWSGKIVVRIDEDGNYKYIYFSKDDFCEEFIE